MRRPRSFIPLVAVVGMLAAALTAAAEPEPTDLVAAGAQTIAVKGEYMAIGAGAVWPRSHTSLIKLDPRTGKVLRRIHPRQIICEAPLVAFDALWSSTCGPRGLVRIDPATYATRFLRLPKKAVLNDEAMIGAGAGSIWLMLDGDGCSACEVARISPRTMRVVATIDVPDGSTTVRFGYGYAWVSNPRLGTVQRIDPKTNAVTATAKVPGEPNFLVAGVGAVWVLGRDTGNVTRIDPKRGTVVATIHAHVANDRGGDIETGAGWVWVRGDGYLLTRIDPKTNKVVKRYGPSRGGGSVAVGYGAVWVGVQVVYRLPLSKI